MIYMARRQSQVHDMPQCASVLHACLLIALLAPSRVMAWCDAHRQSVMAKACSKAKAAQQSAHASPGYRGVKYSHMGHGAGAGNLAHALASRMGGSTTAACRPRTNLHALD